MVQHVVSANQFEKKYQHLRKTDSYFRAEIKISSNDLGYQFKLQEIDDQQGCFFIRENSAVFKMLNVGTVVDMKYWTAEKTRRVKYVSAQINNITRQQQNPFKGHYKVGLAILRTKGLEKVNPMDRLFKARATAEALMQGAYHRH